MDARSPAAAGVFYPRPTRTSSRRRSAPCSRTPRPRDRHARRARAIVVPHGAQGPAGAVAAMGLERASSPHAARVRQALVVGPAHHVPFSGAAAPFAESFATPLGAVSVDRPPPSTPRSASPSSR